MESDGTQENLQFCIDKNNHFFKIRENSSYSWMIHLCESVSGLESMTGISVIDFPPIPFELCNHERS